jgi:hypothetical protein
MGGRKPTHLTSGNIHIRHPEKLSASYHEAKNTDVSRTNTDVSKVVFHPLLRGDRPNDLKCYVTLVGKTIKKETLLLIRSNC